MKLVQYAIATCAVVTVAACGTDSAGSDSAPKCDDIDSTFALIQQQVFENRGCTASACHGESATGGLDLTADNAYASLVNVQANSGNYVRVFPGEQDLSLLYQKVAAKTQGFELQSLPSPISGGTMPTGPDVLSDDDLGLLRAWIRGGAPENGIVEGSEAFASCELEGDIAPNKIQPLPAPAGDKGVQLYSGGWDVPPESEGEVCFVTYYDFSDQVPEEFKVPCDEAQGGPERECFAYKNILLAQDPQSHHSITDFYIPAPGDQEHWDPTNEKHWRDWSCLGGANAGASCTPGSDECGDRGQCTTPVQSTVACIGYQYGPPEMGTVGGLFGDAEVRQNLATAQESTFREDYPPNVFSKMPVKGFVLWDSHAFNLTQRDTSVEQWMNLEFAAPEEQVYPRVQIFDGRNLLGMGRIEAYTSKEVCTSYTLPQHAQLLTLTSHTHRFGKQFRIWYPPNEVCFPDDADCSPPTREPDYISFDYADPLYQRFSGDAIMGFDSENVADRTFRYCSVWDNGESNPAEVRRHSVRPEAETCVFVNQISVLANAAGFDLLPCGCPEEERSCFGGPNEGMACNGDDSVCGDGGVCDACPAGPGVTTEEEMFLVLGSYFVETP
ncbi:MAG: hypothetical protein WBM48_04050 [Polyangiales bacterium]